MQRLRLVSLTVLVPALAVFLSSGCSSGNNKGGGGPEVKSNTDTGRPKAGSGGAKTELASEGWGTIKGKVTYDGTPPARGELKKVIIKDISHCMSEAAKKRGDTRDQVWKVGPDGGVANVVVWLRPADKTKYFKVPDDAKTRTDKIVVDQPYCAFHPHVSVLNPSYFDGKKQVPTGQKFVVVNDATIAHNTKISPSDSNLNEGANPLLPASKVQGEPKGGKLDYEANASEENKVGGEQLLTLSCSIHTWMQGYVWVYDHPFAAVTSGDLDTDPDRGSYTITEVPAGADLEVVYWHEGMTKPMVAQKIKLKKGETADVSFKISQ
jgi:hypothetical protein